MTQAFGRLSRPSVGLSPHAKNPRAVYSCNCLAGAERALAISAPIKRIMSAVFIPIPYPAPQPDPSRAAALPQLRPDYRKCWYQYDHRRPFGGAGRKSGAEERFGYLHFSPMQIFSSSGNGL